MRNVAGGSFTLKCPGGDGVKGNALNDNVVEAPASGGVVVNRSGRVHAVRPRRSVHDADGEIRIVINARDAGHVNGDLIVPTCCAAVRQHHVGTDDGAEVG